MSSQQPERNTPVSDRSEFEKTMRKLLAVPKAEAEAMEKKLKKQRAAKRKRKAAKKK